MLKSLNKQDLLQTICYNIDLCICFYDNAASIFCVLWAIRHHAPLGHLNGTCNFILFALV
jgi:hypothetical protein